MFITLQPYLLSTFDKTLIIAAVHVLSTEGSIVLPSTDNTAHPHNFLSSFLCIGSFTLYLNVDLSKMSLETIRPSVEFKKKGIVI